MVRLGFVGAGGIANWQARYFSAMPDVKLAAVADVVEEKARKFAEKWGIPRVNVFTDYREMYEEVDLDAVTICTPHRFHAAPAIHAMERGLHVLTEKPMAASSEEAYKMWTTSLRTGKILMVGFQTRWFPQLRLARRYVEKGELGKIYYSETTLGGRRRGIPGPTFTMKRTAGGGVTLDLGCYDIDNLMFVLGFPKPSTVTAVTYSALGRNPEALVESGWPWSPDKFEVEDFVAAFIRFSDGSVALLKESWAMHMDTLGQTFILGTKAGLKLGEKLTIYRDEAGTMITAEAEIREKVDIWREKTRSFIEAVRKGGPPPINPAEIVLEQYILDAIYDSANKGREVDVKIPENLAAALWKDKES